ncbi:MAG: radical SAM protein [Promethearchaeota archaeon]
MLSGIHFLLTYSCNFECDHCFLHCGPNSKGTFTLNQIQQVLKEASKISMLEWVYFEGGEPFLFYPLMLEGIKMAQELGFKTGIVTNAYFATTKDDAKLWFSPLCDLGISELSISDDAFHYGDDEENYARRALNAAIELDLPADTICIEKPTVEIGVDKEQIKGESIIKGGAMFRGRAAETLVEGLPKRLWTEFTECPYEDLKEPKRVHLDSYGNVHLCQGLSMGNMWQTPLSQLVKNYKSDSHPICNPLVQGGPALLAKEFKIELEEKYVDPCHFCYFLRKAMMEHFPQYLTPKQVYGLTA